MGRGMIPRVRLQHEQGGLGFLGPRLQPKAAVCSADATPHVPPARMPLLFSFNNRYEPPRTYSAHYLYLADSVYHSFPYTTWQALESLSSPCVYTPWSPRVSLLTCF